MSLELMASLGRLMNGFYGFRCWVVALELGLVKALGERPDSAAALAARTGTDPRAVARLLDALTAIGFLTKVASDSGAAPRYALEPGLEIFAGQSSTYTRHLERMQSLWAKLGETVRTGTPAEAVEEDAKSGFFADFVRILLATNRRAAEIATEALQPFLTARPAPRALDIGAGSGVWSLVPALAVPALRVTALDRSGVLPITKQVFAEHGIGDRLSEIAGDHRQVDLGDQIYDVIFLGHILHSEGRVESERLIERCARALTPGGKLVIGEFVADEARASRDQPRPLLFAVNMLLVTTDGDAFTLSEMTAWMRAAGLGRIVTLPVPGASPVILAERPVAPSITPS
jgi:precorrin-6B methylase 2